MKGKLQAWSDEAEARTFLRQLLIFRGSLRDAVLRLEDGKQPTAAFLANLNARFFAHPMRRAITLKNGKMQSRQIDGTSIADTLWAALLHETDRLLTDTEPTRVRKCESCVVHFLDVSKKDARRWCSMRLCGNRVKVAATKTGNVEPRSRGLSQFRVLRDQLSECRGRCPLPIESRIQTPQNHTLPRYRISANRLRSSYELATLRRSREQYANNARPKSAQCALDGPEIQRT
jgi:predicted RNA-binding Zn ribbon-like protein